MYENVTFSASQGKAGSVVWALPSGISLCVLVVFPGVPLLDHPWTSCYDADLHLFYVLHSNICLLPPHLPSEAVTECLARVSILCGSPALQADSSPSEPRVHPLYTHLWSYIYYSQLSLVWLDFLSFIAVWYIWNGLSFWCVQFFIMPVINSF